MLFQNPFSKVWNRRSPWPSLDLLFFSREVTGKGGSDMPRSHKSRPKVRGPGPEVMGSKGSHSQSPELLLHIPIAWAPPPYVPSPMGLRSGSKLCPPQKERSLSDEICPIREVQDGEGRTMHIVFCSLWRHYPMQGTVGLIFWEPKKI